MSNTRRAHAIVAWLLVGLFAGRVVAQPLSLVVSSLPPFESWHSAALPYWLLLVSQLVILTALGWATYRLTDGDLRPRRSTGAVVLSIGALYFAVMTARLLLGLTLFSHVRWFASPLPTMFHLVLSGWFLVYGHVHWTSGLPASSGR